MQTPFTDAQAPGLYPTKGGPASPPEGGTLAPGGGASWPNRSSFVSMHSMHGAPSLHAAQSMHGTDHTDTSANGGGAPSMVSSVSTMHTPPAPSMIGSMHAPSMHGSMHAPRQLQPQPSFMNGHGCVFKISFNAIEKQRSINPLSFRCSLLEAPLPPLSPVSPPPPTPQFCHPARPHPTPPHPPLLLNPVVCGVKGGQLGPSIMGPACAKAENSTH